MKEKIEVRKRVGEIYGNTFIFSLRLIEKDVGRINEKYVR